MTTPAPAAARTYLSIAAGVHELYDVRDPAETMEAFPGARFTREFVGPGPLKPGANVIALVEDKARPTWDAGGVPVVSVKLLPAEVTAGVWDGQLEQLAAWANVQPDMVLILWHEPEDDFATEAAARGFVASFNRQYKILKAGAPRLIVAYAANSYAWRPSDPRTAYTAIWQALAADLYLCDVYSGNTFRADLILPDHPGFRRWKQMIADYVSPAGIAVRRRWGLGERGISAGTTRAQTIRRELDWLRADGTIAMYLWWNTPGKESNEAWVVDPDDQAHAGDVAALRELLLAVAVPSGYLPTESPGLVVSERSGCVVARQFTGRHDAFLRHLGYAA